MSKFLNAQSSSFSFFIIIFLFFSWFKLIFSVLDQQFQVAATFLAYIMSLYLMCIFVMNSWTCMYLLHNMFTTKHHMINLIRSCSSCLLVPRSRYKGTWTHRVVFLQQRNIRWIKKIRRLDHRRGWGNYLFVIETLNIHTCPPLRGAPSTYAIGIIRFL